MPPPLAFWLPCPASTVHAPLSVACRARQDCKAAAPGAPAGSPSGDAHSNLMLPLKNVACNAAGMHVAHAVRPICPYGTEWGAFVKDMHGMHATLACASRQQCSIPACSSALPFECEQGI